MVAFSRMLVLAEHAIVLCFVWRFLFYLRSKGIYGILRTVLAGVVEGAKFVPGAQAILDKEIQKEIDKIEHKMLGAGDAEAMLSIPDKGIPVNDIVTKTKTLRDQDGFGTGRGWAGIYHEIKGQSALEQLHCDMFYQFHNSNQLFPGIFKSVRKFEAEVVAMAVDLLHGTSKGAVGLLSSGGTESILLAILAYRELARERGIARPQIICSRSAHGALDKACHYFGLDLIKLEPDAETFALVPDQVEASITPDTIAVYASAPSFPHGVVDPVEQLAAITRPRRLGLHVDNCLGGFYLSYLQKQGLFKRKFDFSVDGVTSISIDVHKYGYAPKGVSVVAFAKPHLRRLTIHPVTDGLTLYVTPTLQGSRGGALIAGAWATMLHMGHSGYLAAAKSMNDLKLKVEKEVQSIPGLSLPVPSDLCIIPMGSDGSFDIYKVATLMEKKGWSVFTSQDPPLLSLCLGMQYIRVIDEWLHDLRESVAHCKANPNIKIEGDAAIYGAAKALPSKILGSVMRSYIEVKMKVKPLVKN